MKTVAISNQKGGVGKSTTVSALGAALFRKGAKVLYIDLDAQGNLSYSMGIDDVQKTSMDVIMGNIPAKEAVIHTAQGDLVPSGTALAGADQIITDTGKEFQLKEAIEPLGDSYDYILIDTPPALGTLTVNALTACGSVIIPAQADIFSLQGIGQLSKTIHAVKKYCNPALTVDGILITRYNSRSVLTRDMSELLEDTAKQFGTRLYGARIRECVALREAQASRKSIYDYSPKSNAAVDYAAFAEEFLTEG